MKAKRAPEPALSANSRFGPGKAVNIDTPQKAMELGIGYGKLLNMVKGSEMTVTTYIG